MRKLVSLVSVLLLIVSAVSCGQNISKDGVASPSAVSTPPPSSPVPEGTNILYQLTDYSQMMSYVIKTKDNKLIIIDGGYDRNGKDLVQLAKELTGKQVPEIEAWFLSHVHEDHVDAFSQLMSKSVPELNVKHVYYNFPSRDFVQTYAADTCETYDKFTRALTGLSKDQITIVQMGDSFEISGIQIDVLLTPDERITENPINESSVVYRFTIDGQSVLFLGDAGEASGSRLLKLYKNDIASDIVQMAHHGSYGVAKTFYKRVNPKVCLWPTPKWLWENDGGDGYNTGIYDTIQVYAYIAEQVGVKKHFVAKDGIQMLEFPLDLTK